MSRRITPQEAEEIARKTVIDYISACGICDVTQIGDVLMKLVSVAGVVMAQAEGSESAAQRLHGTGAFIEKTMPRKPAKLETLQ